MSYRVYIDIEDETVFSLIAEWNTRKDLIRHIKSERFGVLLGTNSLLREPLKIWIQTVSYSEGMEAVNEVRVKT